MQAFIFSDDNLTPQDYQFIKYMLSLELPSEPPKTKLYSDDVLKLARQLDLSVEATIEVMSYKRK